MYIYTFLLRMTDTVTSQNIDLSSWEICILYMLAYLFTELSPSREAANCAAIQEIPSNFKEPECSSPCSQEPSTSPYPEPVRSSPYHPIALSF
jgi:hypothetical protein